MANLKVTMTDGSEKELLAQIPDAIHLFIQGYENCQTKDNHDYGDFLFNNESPTRFAILARECIGQKMISEALRVGIIYLFKYLIEEKIDFKTIMISKTQMYSKREEVALICTIRELLMTYFGEAIEEDVNLVICDCKNPEYYEI